MSLFPLDGMLTQFRDRLTSFASRRRSDPDSDRKPSVRPDGSKDRRVRVAQQYMKLRLQGRVDEILLLVSDDITLESSRDGLHNGKLAVEAYLRRVKPMGSWRPVQWNSVADKAEAHGIVKLLRWNVKVVAQFGFNKRGEISRIYVGKKSSVKGSLPP